MEGGWVMTWENLGPRLVLKLLLGLPVLAWILKRLISYALFARKMNRIPGPSNWEIISNAFVFIADLTRVFQFIQDQNRKHGKLWKFWAFNRVQLCCSDARDAEIILKGSKHLEKSSNYSVFETWMGNSLFTMRGEEWRQQRKALHPVFQANSLQKFLPVYAKHSSKMVDAIARKLDKDKSREFSVFEQTGLCSFDIIAETTLGTEMNSQETGDTKFVHAYTTIVRWTVVRYVLFPLKWYPVYYFTQAKLELDKAIAMLNTFTDQLISRRKKYLLNKLDDGKDKNDNETKEENPIVFGAIINGRTQDQVRDDFRAFTFGNVNFKLNLHVACQYDGFDTVATGVGWLIFLIAEHHDVQDRIVEELESVFGSSGRVPDMDDLNDLKYLECCVKESLRMYPSGPVFERTIATPCVLGGEKKYEIPAGVDITFDLYALHRDPEHWGPDPDKFDPDRFLPENSIGRHPYSYLPFCTGPRNCLGQLYAILEMKVIVSTLLRRYRITACNSREYSNLKVGIHLRPKGGLRIKVFERTSHPDLRMIY